MASEKTPYNAILGILTGPFLAQALRSVALLGVADHFGDAPKTTASLAAAVHANEDALRRYLRALAGAGLFEAVTGDRWLLTATGQTLRSDAQERMRVCAIASTNPMFWAVSARLPDALKTGAPQVEPALGSSLWDYFRKHPAQGAEFSAMMSDNSSMVIAPILQSYDFAPAKVVADIGGAHGDLLAAVLRKHPAQAGVLFDIADVLAGARPVLGDTADRIELVPGDFLRGPLPQADLYVLKHILHDWDDENCLTILRRVGEAMPHGAKVLVIEMMLPETGEPSPLLNIDLIMLAMSGGKERTVKGYEDLMNKAKMKLVRTVRTPSPFVILEAILES